VHAAELGTLLAAECDLRGAQRVHARHLAVAEPYANGRLLRLAQRPLGQPFGDALPGGPRDRLKRADRLAQLGQRRDGLLIDAHVRAFTLQNLARE
jgi:hypothetical protein